MRIPPAFRTRPFGPVVPSSRRATARAASAPVPFSFHSHRRFRSPAGGGCEAGVRGGPSVMSAPRRTSQAPTDSCLRPASGGQVIHAGADVRCRGGGVELLILAAKRSKLLAPYCRGRGAVVTPASPAA